MRFDLGLRASLSLAMVGLALVVALFALGIQAAVTLQATVDASAARAEAYARETAVLAGRTATQAGPQKAPDALSHDRLLGGLFETALASDPTLIDIGVYDTTGVALAHSVPALRGQRQERRPPLDLLVAGGVTSQAFRLLGETQTYEEVVPLKAGDHPFGEVRVGVSSALLRAQLLETLRTGAWVAAVALLLAVMVAFALAQLLSRRILNAVEGLQKIGEGAFGHRLAVEGRDELAVLASSIRALGERLAESRARAARGEANPQDLLEATDQMAAWAKVASGLTHEMADPLNAAALSLKHLKRRLGSVPAEARHNLEVLEGELKRLEDILLGFRRFALLGSLTAEWFDPGALLAEVAERARDSGAEHRIEVRLERDGLPGRFWGDASLLRQAVSNLVANAQQAMPGGGRLTIEGRGSDRTIELSVSDEGPGIPEEIQPRIFDLYYTTRAEGTGIGLSVVQQIVQLHGGKIRLRSSAGQGTRITLELPVRAPQEAGVA